MSAVLSDVTLGFVVLFVGLVLTMAIDVYARWRAPRPGEGDGPDEAPPRPPPPIP